MKSGGGEGDHEEVVEEEEKEENWRRTRQGKIDDRGEGGGRGE